MCAHVIDCVTQCRRNAVWKDGVFEKSYRPFSRPGLGGGGVGVGVGGGGIGGKGREVGVGWVGWGGGVAREHEAFALH